MFKPSKVEFENGSGKLVEEFLDVKFKKLIGQLVMLFVQKFISAMVFEPQVSEQFESPLDSTI